MEEAPVHRRFPRYGISVPIIHGSAADAITVGAGWTRDLGEGGACVELDQRIWPQTPLELRLPTERGSIEVEARVVWTGQPDPASGSTLHGVAFTRILPAQRQDLRELILSSEGLRAAGLRLPVALPVTIRPKTRSGLSLHGRTGDISRGGLSLRMLHAFSPGTALELTLHTRKGPLNAEGSIVWAEPPERRKPGELIAHGLRFTAMDWPTSVCLGLVLAESV
jgi:hypothetical protein